MVTYEGYCRPLKQKVEFVVESIDSLETKRGIKWSVKGNYEGHKISTFTNQDTAQDLLSKMSNHSNQEIEVFGAEIAFQEAEERGEKDSFFECVNCNLKDEYHISRDGSIFCRGCGIYFIADLRGGWKEYNRDADLSSLVKEKSAEDTRSELTAKHYKKDGSLDLRYKICREIAASEKKNAESKTVETVEKKTEKITKKDKRVIDEVEDVATEVAVDSVMDAESFDAETYNKVYRAEPNAIIFEENIPAEVWNIMGPDAQGHYLSTRDESVLIAPCCGVTKAELRIDNDANMDCTSCCFSGDDFHPRWWADKPKPEVRLTHGAEEAPMDLTYGNTATVPVDVYYKFMLELPPTVSATVTDDGLSMIIGFHNQYADLIDALIEGYSPYQDAGNPEDTFYAEDTPSFVPSDFNPTSFEAESDRLNSHYSNTLKFTDEELDKLGELYMAAETFNAEMTCPPATKDVAINTKNRNATIKNYGYGPLNVEEPGDFWERIAKQWKTTEKAAKKSKCGNCVAFDRSPRMKDCMPGETSDGEGVLGYCWMHHFKCHSARTCDTWAKGGPITTDKVSEGWQERAFAKPKASKTATEAGKATAKAAESFEAEIRKLGSGSYALDFTFDEANVSWNEVREIIEDYTNQWDATGLGFGDVNVVVVDYSKNNLKALYKELENQLSGYIAWEAEASDLAFWLMPGIGNDIFDTKEEAMERAKELGVNEIHQHKIINNLGNEDIIFMPYKSHQEYERKEGPKRNFGDNLPFNAEYPQFRNYKGALIERTAKNRAELYSDGWDMTATIYKPRKKGNWILQLSNSHPELGDRYKTEVKNFTDGLNLYIKLSDLSKYRAENFDVEFEDWGKQEMKTHGKDVSFKEWLKEESKSHGDVPLMDWAEHEEESHDERYEAENYRTDNCIQCGRFNEYKCDGCDLSLCEDCALTPDEVPVFSDDSAYVSETRNELNRKYEELCKGCVDELTEYYKDDSYDAESFEADATSCFQCGRFGYDDEMMRIDYGYLCARCANPDVDFSKIMAAEESPKISKKLIGLLSIGALGALLAPKEIRKLFDKFKKS